MSTAKKNKFRETPVLENIFVEEAEDKQVIEEPAPEKKTRSKKSKPPKTEEKDNTFYQVLQQKIIKLNELSKTEQFKKISGLLLILSAAYLTVAFVSYFFTGEVDHDKILGPGNEFFNSETKVSNWLGKFGALVAHLLIFRGFGIGSFVLIPVLVLYGVQRISGKEIWKTGSFTAKWLFLMIWTSLTLSWFFSEKIPFLGGGYGYFVNEFIQNLLGSTGLLLLLAFSMLTFLVLTINLSLRFPIKEAQTLQMNINPEPEHEKEDVLSEEEEARMLNFEIIKVNKEPEEIKNDVPEISSDFTNKEEFLIQNNPEPEKIIEDKQPEDTTFEVKQIVEDPVNIDDENKASKLVEEFGEYDPTLDLGSYTFPGFDLLNDYGSGHGKVNQEELVANKDRIINTLKNYGIEIEKIMATVGPTVTLYEIVPAAGVRISKIKNLEDDIALSLAALGIRIIAPIPGKGTIGIEVPNQSPEMVPMRNILASEKFNNSNFELPIALGKTISNEIFIADLAKMPHLLMAGATGQGKSVGLNAILVSLLYKKHPAQIKFVLVDPKKVELTLFNKIERHFLAKLPNAEEAIITDNTRVIHTLNSLCIEMDNRYALLQDAQVRTIKEYNAKFIQRKLNPNEGHKFLPYIVLVVDEFADLIMTAGKEVETPIARLAQLARAVGIHLIIATQRPSVNIITGTIKANFPARIAFRVTSKIDSRTILDSGGAEQLIGRGDMLLSTGNDLIRIQCAFVDTPEVEKITEFIGSQRAYPTAFMLPEYVGEDGDSGKEDIDLSERDKMFDEAAKLVVQFQQGSASFLQRKLKLGYNRAGRIVDQLEAAGIIGPFEGSKAREVLVKDMMQLEDILQKLRN